MMGEIFKGTDDQYYYRVRGANGEIMVVSEGYVSKANAERGLLDLEATLDSDDG